QKTSLRSVKPPLRKSREPMRRRWIKLCCSAFLSSVALPPTQCFYRTINVPQQDIGIGGGPPIISMTNSVHPRHLPSWHHRKRRRPAWPLTKAAHEPTAVDMDVPDLMERKSTIKIKPAKFHNLRAVSRLLVAEFYGATLWYPAQCLTELNRLQTNFHGYGEDAGRHLMLLATSLEDGSLVGFVDIDGREKRPGQTGVRPYLSDLAVANRCQRMGIGTELVKACEEACIGWGFDHMYLKVRVGNVAARKLYENLGYVVHSPSSFGFMVETGNKQAEIMLCGDLRARARAEGGAAAEE
ncbi:unnamed protein product, partial [Scytosiphon promiscuus]